MFPLNWQSVREVLEVKCGYIGGVLCCRAGGKSGGSCSSSSPSTAAAAATVGGKHRGGTSGSGSGGCAVVKCGVCKCASESGSRSVYMHLMPPEVKQLHVAVMRNDLRTVHSLVQQSKNRTSRHELTSPVHSLQFSSVDALC